MVTNQNYSVITKNVNNFYSIQLTFIDSTTTKIRKKETKNCSIEFFHNLRWFHCHRFFCVLSLQLVGHSGTTGCLPLQNLSTVFIQLQLDDDYLRWVDPNVYGGAVRFFSGDFIDMDNIFSPIAANDLR